MFFCGGFARKTEGADLVFLVGVHPENKPTGNFILLPGGARRQTRQAIHPPDLHDGMTRGGTHDYLRYLGGTALG